jgi:hypothetical protein
MDSRLSAAILSMIAVVAGVSLIVTLGQAWGGLLVGLGIAGWIFLWGTRDAGWDGYDLTPADPPEELVGFLGQPSDNGVLWIEDLEA